MPLKTACESPGALFNNSRHSSESRSYESDKAWNLILEKIYVDSGDTCPCSLTDDERQKIKISLRSAYSHPSYPGEDELHRILTAPKREVVSSRIVVDPYATRIQILPRRLGSKALTAGLILLHPR